MPKRQKVDAVQKVDPVDPDVIAYVTELREKLHRGEPVKMRINEHIVEVLTRSLRRLGGKCTVAVNDGTRVRTCTALYIAFSDTEDERRWIDIKCKETKERLKEEFLDKCVCEGSSSTEPIPTLPADGSRANSAARSLTFSTDASGLAAHGAMVVAKLSTKQVCAVTAALARSRLATEKKLSRVQGNGEHGAYATIVGDDRGLPGILQVVMQACKQWIVKKTGCDEEIGSKALLLRYGEGGENYAHHDGCGDYDKDTGEWQGCGEYQALLMLSQRGVDYDGGSFYLVERDDPQKLTEFPLEAGELLVFRGGKAKGARKSGSKSKYLHGMTKVTKAEGSSEARRFAVGLFQ